MFTKSQDEAPLEKQTAPKQLDKSKSAFLTQSSQEESPSKNVDRAKKLDQSKLNFLQETNDENTVKQNEKILPTKLNMNKLAQMEDENDENKSNEKVVSNQVRSEILISDSEHFLFM